MRLVLILLLMSLNVFSEEKKQSNAELRKELRAEILEEQKIEKEKEKKKDKKTSIVKPESDNPNRDKEGFYFEYKWTGRTIEGYSEFEGKKETFKDEFDDVEDEGGSGTEFSIYYAIDNKYHIGIRSISATDEYVGEYENGDNYRLSSIRTYTMLTLKRYFQADKWYNNSFVQGSFGRVNASSSLWSVSGGERRSFWEWLFDGSDDEDDEPDSEKYDFEGNGIGVGFDIGKEWRPWENFHLQLMYGLYSSKVDGKSLNESSLTFGLSIDVF